ncbi:MAG: hypothetical protein JNK56_12065 [Myxococcales bacterium]|nr:hypothetical protein [Myxococcales bacterium]
MHGESSHQQQRGTCNLPGAPVAIATATDEHDLYASSRAATRPLARARAFADLLAEATLRGADTQYGASDEPGLLTPIMP